MPEAEVAEAPAGVPDAPAAEPVDAPAAAPEAAPADPFDTGDTQFSREYVERLRNEAAEHRTKLKGFEETFDGYNEDERAALLDLARTLRTDPQTAAAWMEQVVTNIRGGLPEPEKPAATEPAAPEADRPLTLKDLESYMGQKEAKATEERLMSEVLDEVKGLGVEPSSTDGIAVMKVAAEQTGGDIKAAYKIAVEDRNQKIIDDYIAKKAADANTPGAVSPGGSPSGERTRPPDVSPMQWATMLAKERIANLP